MDRTQAEALQPHHMPIARSLRPSRTQSSTRRYRRHRRARAEGSQAPSPREHLSDGLWGRGHGWPMIGSLRRAPKVG